jgi:hypothetical protein
MKLWTGAAAALAFSAGAFAAQLAGVHLDETLRVQGQKLDLVSCGVRDTLWMDAYVAGLYVPPGTTAQAARDPTRAKAVRLSVVNATYLPGSIPQRWRGILQAELNQDPLARVRRAYDDLSDGDVVTFAYLPQEGVSMSVNGREVAQAPGQSLIDSILDSWAGKDPISGKLHRLRLEHPC